MHSIHSYIDRTKRWLGIPVSVRPLISISEDITKGKIRHIASKAGGLGDELMALGVTQAAKRIHPTWNCVFHSRYDTLLKDAPEVNAVVPFEAAFDEDRVEFIYEHKSKNSLNQQMAIQLGITPADYRIDLPNILIPSWITSKFSGQVNLVLQTDSSGWTSNKDWPFSHWLEFVESLPSDWLIFEVGRTSLFEKPPRHPGFHSLSGKTSLLEYAACIKKADCFVGPPSGGMHLAHAYRVPSVIVVGGYEAAHYPYPLAHQIGTDVSCAPCWLREPCPYNWTCLRRISAKEVYSAVLAILQFPSEKLPGFR